MLFTPNRPIEDDGPIDADLHEVTEGAALLGLSDNDDFFIIIAAGACEYIAFSFCVHPHVWKSYHIICFDFFFYR